MELGKNELLSFHDQDHPDSKKERQVPHGLCPRSGHEDRTAVLAADAAQSV